MALKVLYDDKVAINANAGIPDINKIKDLDMNNIKSFLLSGWNLIEGVTFTFSSADSPTFVISVNADVTGLIGLGDRIKLTQTTVKYFIVTAVGTYSGGATLITVYGGTDYTLTSASIANLYYSHEKSPFGFPTAKSKWTKTTTTAYYINLGAPTDNTVYNPDGISIDIPIGEWDVYVEAIYRLIRPTAGTMDVNAGISTSSNSLSSIALVEADIYSGQTSLQKVFKVQTTLTLASKTRYYHVVQVSGSLSGLEMQNGFHPSIIKAVCNYL